MYSHSGQIYIFIVFLLVNADENDVGLRIVKAGNALDLFGRSQTSASKIEKFHYRCWRVMCRVNKKHTLEHRISNGTLNVPFEICKQQLRWAGHVVRVLCQCMVTKKDIVSSWIRSK